MNCVSEMMNFALQMMNFRRRSDQALVGLQWHVGHGLQQVWQCFRAAPATVRRRRERQQLRAGLGVQMEQQDSAEALRRLGLREHDDAERLLW